MLCLDHFYHGSEAYNFDALSRSFLVWMMLKTYTPPSSRRFLALAILVVTRFFYHCTLLHPFLGSSNYLKGFCSLVFVNILGEDLSLFTYHRKVWSHMFQVPCSRYEITIWFAESICFRYDLMNDQGSFPV